MKRWSLFLALSAALVACGKGSTPSTTSTTSATSSASIATSVGPSLYPLALTLHDQGSRAIPLDVYRGHPVIISMFYASCPAACPLLVSQIKKVEAALAPNVRDDTRVLMVSFDPEHDTPDVLRALVDRHRVDPARWTFATGSADDVATLAAALDIAYRKLPEGGYSHSSVITVLDREGRVVVRSEDVVGDVTPLADAVARADRK